MGVADFRVALRNSIMFVACAIIFAAFLATIVSCSKNAFSESAQKTTDPALMFEAQKKLDNSDFTGAIEVLLSMTSTGLANHEAKALLGSAYAGRCGLNLISLADAVANLGTSKLFEKLKSEFSGATATNITDCIAAETALTGITSPTNDEKVLLAFVEFSKIGAILAATADTNGDGVIDAGFPCNVAQLSDTYARHIGTGITIAAMSLSGTSIGSGAMGTVSTLCSSIDAFLKLTSPTYSGFCLKTSTSDWQTSPVDEVTAIRSVVKSDEIGLKVCTGGITACHCP